MHTCNIVACQPGQPDASMLAVIKQRVGKQIWCVPSVGHIWQAYLKQDAIKVRGEHFEGALEFTVLLRGGRCGLRVLHLLFLHTNHFIQYCST